MILRSRGPSTAAIDLGTLREALAGVEDPELHETLGALGMLGEVAVRGGVVTATVRLTTPSCPFKDRITADLAAAATNVTGVSELEITLESMTESERMRLASRLRESRAVAGHQGSHGPANRIYAVASGKGGVGKSSLTANLAVALAQQGQRVGVLDADVWGWSIPQLFGVRRAPVALKGLMLPVEAHGVALMSVGFLVDDNQPVVWRGPMLHKAIEQFLNDVHWGDLDTLLIDLPPGTGDVTLSLLQLVPDAALIAVTTPQVTAQTVAARVGRMARDARMPVAGVVENMTTTSCPTCATPSPMFGSGGGKRLAESIAAPLLGQVPLDLALRESCDVGVPAVVGSPAAPSATEIRRIATDLPTVRRTLVGRSLPLAVL